MTVGKSSRSINFGMPLGTAAQAQTLDRDAPFRILVLGDFSGRTQRGTFASGEELARQRPQLIDRDNFEEVIRRLGVVLTGLLVTSDQQSVSLRIEELDDFDPDILYDKLDLFTSFRNLRDRLLNPKTFDDAAKEVMKWSSAATIAEQPPSSLDATVVPEPPQVDQLLDQILDDAQQNVPAGTGSIEFDLQRLIAKIASPYAIPAADPRQKDMVKCVDSAIQATMVALLQHPGFKQLEANWRALHQLVFDLNTDVSLKVYLIDISTAELSADLFASDDLTQTHLYRLLVEEPVNTPGGLPWAIVAGSYYFSPGEQNVAALGRLARIAAAAGAPFVVGAENNVVGCADPDATPNSANWKPDTGGPWQQLRDLPESSWLGLVWPRFLLRLPYGESTRPIERFSFEEIASIRDRRRLLWGNPAFLIANLLGQAFTQSGWDLAPGEVNELDDMPVLVYQDDDGSHAQPCGEILLSENAASRVSACGVMPVISIQNQAAIRLVGYHSLRGTPLLGRWR